MLKTMPKLSRVTRKEQHRGERSKERAMHRHTDFWLTQSTHMPDALSCWNHTLLISWLRGKSRISEQASMKSVPITAGKLKAHYMQHDASHALSRQPQLCYSSTGKAFWGKQLGHLTKEIFKSLMPKVTGPIVTQ